MDHTVSRGRRSSLRATATDKLKPMPEDGTSLAMAMQAWPDDLLELAEALIAAPREADRQPGR